MPSRGEVDAESKGQVTEQLRERGLIVLDVSEKNEAFKLESAFDRFRSIKMRDLSVFARQFATLVASGMPMLRSLYTLEDQTEDERLKDAIGESGRTWRRAARWRTRWKRRPQIFEQLFRAMVRSGESSGRLEECAGSRRLSAGEAGRAEAADPVRPPLPGVRLHRCASLIMLAVVIFIVPVFAEAFKEAVQDQPGESSQSPDDPDSLMVEFSDFLKGYWYIWVPA